MKFSFNIYTHTYIHTSGLMLYDVLMVGYTKKEEGIHLQKLCKFIAVIHRDVKKLYAAMLKFYLMQQFFSMDAFNWMLHLKPDFI